MKITVTVPKETQDMINELKRITDEQINMQELYDKAFAMGVGEFVQQLLAAVNTPE
jgi:lysylphosphatidylglycerol synthetase-like protein (DUF2156 family)